MTVTGTAVVTLSGARFHADLRPGLGQTSQGLTLDGRISASRVRATEVMLNTDAAPMPVSGTIHRTPLGNDIIEEKIVFRGGQSGDASYLGLARSIRLPAR